MSHRCTIAVLVCALLAGCASLGNGSPRLAYADRHHPLADTAILSCAGNPGYTCSIDQVDGKSTWDHYNGGETLWVRVLPGAHRVRVVASDGRAVDWLSFDLKDARPGHVYRIELAQAPPALAPRPDSRHVHGGGARGASMVVSCKDLGRMVAYTIRVGQKSIYPRRLTAHF